jgi:hypothetical protein
MTHTDAFLRKILPTRESHTCTIPRVFVQMLFLYLKVDGVLVQEDFASSSGRPGPYRIARVVDAISANDY